MISIPEYIYFGCVIKLAGVLSDKMASWCASHIRQESFDIVPVRCYCDMFQGFASNVFDIPPDNTSVITTLFFVTKIVIITLKVFHGLCRIIIKYINVATGHKHYSPAVLSHVTFLFFNRYRLTVEASDNFGLSVTSLAIISVMVSHLPI